EDVLQAPVFGEQLLGALLADSLDPGDVVRGVTNQGKEVDDLPGAHAEPFGSVGFVDPTFVDRRGAAATRVEQGDPGADELVEVLVARDDDRLEPAAGAGGGQGADHVVGLVAGYRDERDAE